VIRRIAGVASIAGLAIWGLAGCGGGDTTTTTTSSPPSPAPQAITSPSGPPPGSTERGLRELEPGDCFDRMDDPEASSRAVWLIECRQSHSHEVYEVLPYEGDGAAGGTPYPGTAVVQDWSEQACYDRFEAFVGVRWTLSELDIEVWWPSEDSWARGDRTVICSVMSISGDHLEGTQRDVAR
jgi:hypothetical protein